MTAAPKYFCTIFAAHEEMFAAHMGGTSCNQHAPIFFSQDSSISIYNCYYDCLVNSVFISSHFVIIYVRKKAI